MRFVNDNKQDFNNYKAFLSIYKPLVTYSPDSSQFVDIYSYQLNLEKKGDHYEAYPELEQAVFLCNLQKKYWNSIFFGTNSIWIDEVIWISPTNFILAGIIKSSGDKKMPLLLLGDTNSQTMKEYLTQNKQCFQSIQGYQSSKLNRLRIKGL